MTKRMFRLAALAAATFASMSAFGQDGTFSGEAVGVWGTPVQALVTVKDGKVAEIEARHNETPALGGVAIARLRSQIIAAQTLKVDAVSGATLSSVAFRSAVKQAVDKAGVKLNGPKPAAACRGNDAADVVVVGAGPSGMMAAIELKRLGLKVVLLEKQGIVGGNGSYVSTSYKAGGSKPQIEQGIPSSSVPDFERYLAGHKGATAQMSKVVAEESRFVVDYLIAHGADLGKVSKTYSMGPKDGSAPGYQITPAFAKGLDEEQIDLRVNSPAVALLRKDRRVIGVKVAPKDCSPYEIRARAVILATGGFSASKQQLAKYAPNLATLGTTNAPGTKGDGYDLAAAAGAKLVNMEGVSVNPATYNTGHALLSFTPIRYQSMMVSKDGVRFVDVNIPDKNAVTAAMLKASGGTGHAYLIFDQEVYESLGIAREYVKKGYILSAPTIPELAAKLGVNGANLEKTVTNFARYAKEGKDPEFNQKRFECRFVKAPYYGVQVEPAVHASKGGIAINERGQALDASGTPIAGLFAIGQVTESQLGLHNTFVFGGPALSRNVARFIASGAGK